MQLAQEECSAEQLEQEERIATQLAQEAYDAVPLAHKARNAVQLAQEAHDVLQLEEWQSHVVRSALQPQGDFFFFSLPFIDHYAQGVVCTGCVHKRAEA